MDELSFLAVLGICLILAGIFLLARSWLFRARAVRVPGRITKLNVVPAENGNHIRDATVEFITEDGREITTKGGDIGRRPLREGSPVTVLYHPKKPTLAYIQGTSMRGGWVGGMFICFGLCFALVIVLFLLIGPEGTM
ncbi:DUF3592 domain-containing protein [Plantactinospora sp. KLBMP9567]|uniref:DUF3592 domain-containing protein n=1 Tax=Plantactinospora sp. KLBMP9567 TaxID=3085900 RepID=UPI0029826251|nr:DUF3592 domain-containing protein [Plantactinospora sp. KLBMP9567]MDW5328850.1 DUF3592 domain-containing protein [Plantactinospora sp. KLBMP9567]